MRATFERWLARQMAGTEPSDMVRVTGLMAEGADIIRDVTAYLAAHHTGDPEGRVLLDRCRSYAAHVMEDLR